MKSLIAITLFIITLLGYSQIFAETFTAPDWRSQNANLEEQQANTARTNADTAAINANTAAKIANTASVNANTQATMITPVPAPNEANVAPAGYESCFVVEAKWVNGIWVPKHRVCKYTSAKEGAAWIEGYWACIKYRTIQHTKGECTNWEWKQGRWEKSVEVY